MTGEWSYVYAAYALTWGTLLVYGWLVRGRIREAERELSEPIEPGAVYRGADAGGDLDRDRSQQEDAR